MTMDVLQHKLKHMALQEDRAVCNLHNNANTFFYPNSKLCLEHLTLYLVWRHICL